MDDLTEKQRRFVEAFIGDAQGNATEASRLAGYKGSTNALAVQGCENLKNPKIRSAIENARAPTVRKAILTAADRQALLTQFANDEVLEPKDRIKAIEVLGRMQGDFIERREVEMTAKVVRVVMPTNGRGPE